jgi:hypothetical protein
VSATAFIWPLRRISPKPATRRTDAFLRAATPDDADLAALTREDLELECGRLRRENAALRTRVDAPTKSGFSLPTAALCAGFAFECYNDPANSRWERGADGCDVAFRSTNFIRSCYAGAALVRVARATGLRGPSTGGLKLEELALSGAGVDAYCLLQVVERASKRSQRARSSNATDVARTATVWRAPDPVEWPGQAYACLYVADPKKAALAIRVFDEDVASEDRLLGVGEVPLSRALVSGGERRWTVDLSVDAEDKIAFDGGALLGGAALGAAAGLATGGVALAAMAAAGLRANMLNDEKKGRVELDLRYAAFDSDADVAALDADARLLNANDVVRGASPEAGVDWSRLSDASGYEALCFVDHAKTGTQAGLWRDASREKLLVSFRGTSEPRDVVTDASALMTPWAREAELERDDYDDSVPPAAGDPSVHAGFRGALDSIAMRLKQLVLVACDDAPGAWELQVTGHSLGGALATLFSFDVAYGVDASRALPVRRPRSRPWFLGSSSVASVSDAPKFASIDLVTLGAPRVGDAAFASRLDVAVPNHSRLVNGQDIVARLPRGFSYAHGGSTVLVSPTADIWVEGEDAGACPLKRGDGGLSGVVTRPAPPGSPLATLLDDALGEARSVKPFDVQSALEAATRLTQKSVSTISGSSSSELLGSVGLDATYVEAELKMLSALTSGGAIDDHLEPAYFAAMTRAVEAASAEA